MNKTYQMVPDVADMAVSPASAQPPLGNDIAARQQQRGATSAMCVRFAIPFNTRFGQNVVVVGNVSVLGAWDPQKGLRLSWQPGGVWAGQADLPREVCLY